MRRTAIKTLQRFQYPRSSSSVPPMIRRTHCRHHHHHPHFSSWSPCALFGRSSRRTRWCLGSRTWTPTVTTTVTLTTQGAAHAPEQHNGDDGEEAAVREAVMSWLKNVVIGLNLCPFASGALTSGGLQIHIMRSREVESLYHRIMAEAHLLATLPKGAKRTSLMVIVHVLQDFYDFNDFTTVVNEALEDLELSGSVQLATFHPRYCFAEQEPDDPENLTNRSPYPILHFLREVEVEAAVNSYGDTSRIYRRNMALMRRLGAEGVR